MAATSLSHSVMRTPQFATTSRLGSSTIVLVAMRPPPSASARRAFGSAATATSSLRRPLHRPIQPRFSSSTHPPAASLALRTFSTSPIRSDAQGASSSSSPPPPPPPSSSRQSEGAEDAGAGERPSFTQRMRFLFKRYGWWAFAVYNLWSLVDFSLTWAIIHWAGADYIRELETKVREAVGMGERETTDAEVAQWPLNGQTPAILEGVTSPPSGHQNNEPGASEAVDRLVKGTDESEAARGKMSNHSGGGQKGGDESKHGGSGTLWAEAVLAYTIHKTLLLPFRVMGTGAVTPSFVKYMVKLGWAKPLPPLAAAGATATAAKVGSATSAVASKGAQDAAKKGAASAVRK